VTPRPRERTPAGDTERYRSPRAPDEGGADPVDVASEGSFPASDPPPFTHTQLFGTRVVDEARGSGDAGDAERD
jgi:hypothetical protein